MPDTVAPPGPLRPENPDPAFWGPPRPIRRERRGLARPRAATGSLDRALDRLREWRGDPRVGVAALVAVALVAGFAWYRIGLGSGGNAGASPGPPASPAVATTEAAAGGDLMVHVAGAVTRPGVIELPDGSRVIDAVEAAGGGVPEADLDRINLAAKLVDGQRILVQRVGDPALPADPSPPGSPAADGPGPTSELVNLNSATQEQLESLPGIGPVLAEAIIAERDRRGGFRSVNELRDVRGIGDKRFADLEPLVTV